MTDALNDALEYERNRRGESKQYRTVLERYFEEFSSDEVFVFIMLNPSKADAIDQNKNDKTVKRCMGFAKEKEVRKMLVLNLFSRYATKPKSLSDPLQDEGATNRRDAILKKLKSDKNVTFIVAWGSINSLPNRASLREAFDTQVKQVWNVLENLESTNLIKRFVPDKVDYPPHPSRLSKPLSLEPWKRSAEETKN